MPEEIKVRRGNVILRVPEYQKGEYLARGFDVISEDGKVVEATVPSDVNILKKAYVEHLAKIKELEAKLAEATKKTPVKKVEKDVIEKEETPKKRTAKKA